MGLKAIASGGSSNPGASTTTQNVRLPVTVLTNGVVSWSQTTDPAGPIGFYIGADADILGGNPSVVEVYSGPPVTIIRKAWVGGGCSGFNLIREIGLVNLASQDSFLLSAKNGSVNAVLDYSFGSNAAFYPFPNATANLDLGGNGKEFKDLWVKGRTHTGQNVANVAGNIMTIGKSNYFQVNTNDASVLINGILDSDWSGGDFVRMKFNSAFTVVNNGVVPFGSFPIKTKTSANVVLVAGNTLMLTYDVADSVWYQM